MVYSYFLDGLIPSAHPRSLVIIVRSKHPPPTSQPIVNKLTGHVTNYVARLTLTCPTLL